ncbi:Unknown protein, partial [Striga hermonthica]
SIDSGVRPDAASGSRRTSHSSLGKCQCQHQCYAASANVRERIRREQASDEFVRVMEAKVCAGGVEGFQLGSDGALGFRGRIVVPKVEALRKEILSEAHTAPYLPHPGSTKMYHDLEGSFWWRGIKKDVAEFVRRCFTCQQVKVEHQSLIGLLQPLLIPRWKWEAVTMDFVTGLPRSSEHHDAIWVVVDRLTKVANFLPVSMKMSLDKLAEIYTRGIIRLHGVIITIVSDRDPRFVSRFWHSLHEAMGTKLEFSSAYHLKTDGQSERTIQTLEDMLRALVVDSGAKWESLLPYAEFAYNNNYHSFIQMAPYEVLYGRKCRSPLYWDD